MQKSCTVLVTTGSGLQLAVIYIIVVTSSSIGVIGSLVLAAVNVTGLLLRQHAVGRQEGGKHGRLLID